MPHGSLLTHQIAIGRWSARLSFVVERRAGGAGRARRPSKGRGFGESHDDAGPSNAKIRICIFEPSEFTMAFLNRHASTHT